MKRTLAFAKGSEELPSVKVDFFHISKCSFLEKVAFKTLPNAHKIFLVSKSAFYHLKVQKKGHLTTYQPVVCFYNFNFKPSPP